MNRPQFTSSQGKLALAFLLADTEVRSQRRDDKDEKQTAERLLDADTPGFLPKLISTPPFSLSPNPLLPSDAVPARKMDNFVYSSDSDDVTGLISKTSGFCLP
jgi:hypothetical protein